MSETVACNLTHSAIRFGSALRITVGLRPYFHIPTLHALTPFRLQAPVPLLTAFPWRASI